MATRGITPTQEQTAKMVEEIIAARGPLLLSIPHEITHKIIISHHRKWSEAAKRARWQRDVCGS